MNESLLNAVRRYAEAYAGPTGLAQTPIPGLTIIRSVKPSGLEYALSRPLACLVLQGCKQVAMGAEVFAFSAGDSLLITGDVPTVSQVTRASAPEPYFSVVLDLDLKVIAALAVEMRLTPVAQGQGSRVRVEPTDGEVANSALRLMHLVLERPAATSLSPLQFQKQLRLIEARRLMAANDMTASSAAFAVGYESVQQFTREYRRMFGLPPGKGHRHLKAALISGTSSQ